MNKLMMSAGAIALCLGSSAVFAQDTEKTTTTVSSPSGMTETTTTKTSDGYKQYVRTITATKHYNMSVFMGPPGYVYTRYTIGDRAPSMLLGGRYTLKHSTYGLEAPPDGLTWIRTGDDALLVDAKTGEVVQTDYSLFSN